ncbi:MAG: hypothetical protein LBI39_02835 [Puniceicoccales bacterium]|nr:hypothetical protein [Puniceicoccales bacterium]
MVLRINSSIVSACDEFIAHEISFAYGRPSRLASRQIKCSAVKRGGGDIVAFCGSPKI